MNHWWSSLVTYMHHSVSMSKITIRYGHKTIDLSPKSHNARGKYPTIHFLVTEMCTCLHISVKSCVKMHYDICDCCIVESVWLVYYGLCYSEAFWRNLNLRAYECYISRGFGVHFKTVCVHGKPVFEIIHRKVILCPTGCYNIRGTVMTNVASCVAHITDTLVLLCRNVAKFLGGYCTDVYWWCDVQICWTYVL